MTMDAKLYKAVSSGDSASFQRFITDADPNILLKETPHGNTILHIAALYRQIQIVQEILHHHPSLLYHTNSEEDTPLHIAARVGCLEIVELLLNCADNSGSQEVEAGQIFPTRIVNLLKDTVLHDAIRNDHLDVVELLIHKDPGLALLSNVVGESPLFLAVEKKLFPIAKYLIQSTEQCSFEGRDGMNALHAAILRFYEMDILKDMVRKHPTAVGEADKFECTPLYYAAFLGCVESVELFVTDESLAIYNNDFVYKKDKKGMSAFHVAAQNGHVQVMTKLIEICPDISELLNCNGQTALHVAVQGGKKLAVQYLLKKLGPEGVLNKQDKDGNTPLHLAAILEDSPILLTLLKENKVDAKVVNKDGLTAVDIIHSSTELHTFQKKSRISKLLKRRDAVPNLRQAIIRENMGIMQNIESETQPSRRELEAKTREERNREEVRKRKYSFLKSPSYNALKEASAVDMLTATIIATVTFAAAFQVPGGYETNGGSNSSYKGLPLLRNKRLFISFIICDSLAFGLSSSSIFLHIQALMKRDSIFRKSILTTALLLTLYSIPAMIGAFISALYLVSQNSVGVKFAAFVCGSSFLLSYAYAIFGSRSFVWKISR